MTRLLLLFAVLSWASPSWGAASVATHTVVSTTGAGSLSTGTFTATAGNTIVVMACLKANVGSSISTSGSDTETVIDSGNNTIAGWTPRFAYFPNIAGGGSYSVTLSPAGGTPAMAMTVVQLSGVTIAPLDATAQGAAVVAATSTSAGPSATTAQADEIAVAGLCSDSVLNPATVTAGSGWTLSDSVLNGSGSIVAGMETKVLASTQTVTADFTHDSTTTYLDLATFKASGGGGGPDLSFFFRRRVQ